MRRVLAESVLLRSEDGGLLRVHHCCGRCDYLRHRYGRGRDCHTKGWDSIVRGTARCLLLLEDSLGRFDAEVASSSDEVDVRFVECIRTAESLSR